MPIKNGIEHWYHYLHGKPFTLVTDHATLQYFQGQPKLSPRQVRWLAFMQPLGFKIQYKPGKENVVADALSRDVRLHTHEVESQEQFKTWIRDSYRAEPYFGDIWLSLTTGKTEPKMKNKLRKFFEKEGLILAKESRGCVYQTMRK